MKKTLLAFGFIALGAIAFVLIMDSLYLFSPFTFRQDNIINCPYTWYRKPITIKTKYEGSTRELPQMHDAAKSIYAELKKSEVLGSIADEAFISTLKLVQKGSLYIQSADNLTLTKLRWYGKEAEVCCTTGNFGYEAIVKMTPELKVQLDSLLLNQGK